MFMIFIQIINYLLDIKYYNERRGSPTPDLKTKGITYYEL